MALGTWPREVARPVPGPPATVVMVAAGARPAAMPTSAAARTGTTCHGVRACRGSSSGGGPRRISLSPRTCTDLSYRSARTDPQYLHAPDHGRAGGDHRAPPQGPPSRLPVHLPPERPARRRFPQALGEGMHGDRGPRPHCPRPPTLRRQAPDRLGRGPAHGHGVLGSPHAVGAAPLSHHRPRRPAPSRRAGEQLPRPARERHAAPTRSGNPHRTTYFQGLARTSDRSVVELSER